MINTNMSNVLNFPIVITNYSTDLHGVTIVQISWHINVNIWITPLGQMAYRANIHNDMSVVQQILF